MTPSPSTESGKEEKDIKTIVATILQVKDSFDSLLEKNNLQKALRVSTWLSGFKSNCCKSKKRVPLTTPEIYHQERF